MPVESTLLGAWPMMGAKLLRKTTKVSKSAKFGKATSAPQQFTTSESFRATSPTTYGERSRYQSWDEIAPATVAAARPENYAWLQRREELVRRVVVAGITTYLSGTAAWNLFKIITQRGYDDLGRHLGSGAYGCVSAARSRRTGEIVAVKESFGREMWFLQREAKMLRSLPNHPNLVRMVGFSEDARRGVAKLYLELANGGSLLDLLQMRRGRLEEKMVRQFTRQLLMGLKELHDRGILHRDLKPGNILVFADKNGGGAATLKLADFGHSRRIISANAHSAAGTPAYAAPEAIHGRYSAGSDLWSLGATVLQLATGKLPWSHLSNDVWRNGHALLFHIGNGVGEAGHAPEIDPSLSQQCREFLAVCFAARPEERGTCETLLRHPFLANP